MLKQSVFQQNRPHGFTLIEALISVAVLSFGLLAIGSFQAKLVTASAYNKARAEAITLAQEKLDEMRSYTTEHGLVENLTDNTVTDPAAGAQFVFPDNVPAATTVYPVDAAESIPGTNATFSREWDVTRVGELSNVVVTVSWTDREGTQSVSLETDVSWRNPRGTADVSKSAKPLVASPTGKAYLGDGSLDEQQMSDLKTNQPDTANNDGTYSADHDNDGDLELVVESSDGTGEVVLTLPDACKLRDPVTDLPICTDFVTISGTVFFDRTGGTSLDGGNIWVIASDAAYCSRWRPVSASATELTTSTKLIEGNTSLLPGTDGDIYRNNNPQVDSAGNGDGTDDYDYFNYTCYLGGGWYGNIGLVMLGANSQDFACVGDPNAGILDSWKQVELAKRRVYRGVLYQYTIDGNGDHVPVQLDGETVWYSNGIKDAAVLPDPTWAERAYGHDFVISRGNDPTSADCVAVLTRPDADEVVAVSPAPSYPQLFHSMPDDFVCLNEDGNNPAEGVDPRIGAFAKFVGYPWDYLTDFDETVFDAETSCDYDPSDPPSKRYTISGVLTMDSETSSTWGSTDPAGSTFDGNINTTDGYDNCTITSTTAGGTGYDISYSCDYYVWSTPDNQGNLIETPWNGSVVVNSPVEIVCTHDNPYDQAELSWQAVYGITGATGSQTANFVCHDLTEFTIQGTVTVDGGNDLGAIAGGLQFAAYDASGELVADACQTTNASALSVDYICTGLLEQTYVSGFTGHIELTVPTDYSCVIGGVSTTDASATSCADGGVVSWGFTDFQATPAQSTGNDVVFDGPVDEYKITGTITNSTTPSQDLLTGMVVNTNPAPTGTCNWDIAANNKDVKYSCVVAHDTRLTATWAGSVLITPPNGFWCGTDTAGTSIDLSITSDTTAASVDCVKDTSGPITIQGSVYVPTPYFINTRYESVALGSGDYAYVYENVGYGNGDLVQEFYQVAPGTGNYEEVNYEYVGAGNGNHVQTYDFVGANAGTHDKVEYEYVGPNNGSYIQDVIYVGWQMGSYNADWYEFVGTGNGEYVQVPWMELVGQGNGSYSVDNFEYIGPGLGEYTAIDGYMWVGDGMGSYMEEWWVYVGAGNGELLMEYVPNAGGDYRQTGPTTYEYVGWGNGDHYINFIWVGMGLGDYNWANLPIYTYVGPGVGYLEPSGIQDYWWVGFGLGDYNWLNIPNVTYVGTGNGAYSPTGWNDYWWVGAGLGDYIYSGVPTYYYVGANAGEYDVTFVPVAPGTGDYEKLLTPRYDLVGGEMGDYVPRDPIDYTMVADGTGDYIKYTTPRYNSVGAGQGDWMPSEPATYKTVGEGMGNYIMHTPQQFVGAGNGDYLRFDDVVDLVTLSASMDPVPTAPADDCTFSTEPVGGVSPPAQWYNFECTTDVVMHHETWAGSVTVTTNAPWGSCPLPNYPSSYSGVLPGTLVDDAFSAIDYPDGCIDYTNGNITLALPWTPTYTP